MDIGSGVFKTAGVGGRGTVRGIPRQRDSSHLGMGKFQGGRFIRMGMESYT